METKRYQVIISDRRESVAEVMLEEYFDTLEGAQGRFDELKKDFDFYENDEMWLSECLGDSTWSSLDHYSEC